MNPIEEILVVPLRAGAEAFMKLDKEFQIVDKLDRMDQKNEELKKEHPILYTGLQITKATTKALFGVYLFPPK
ncbi:hypothetical protein [Methanosarcina sp.]|uniref:hypothetical protein n=1 Tax=Methanosarcina sp. TaxID=2213 RepID=UPI003BB80FD8